MIAGEGKTTREIFTDLAKQLKELETLMTNRRRRDRACMLLTDASVGLEALARRLSTIEFTGGPVARDEDDSLEQEEADPGVSMMELMDVATDGPELLAADEMGIGVREMRLYYFRLFLDYHLRGCRTLEDVLRKFMAYARRFRPEVMRDLGLSQTDVGVLLGKSRQNINAGEKRLVEKPLKRIGAKGYIGLGGQKSSQHRDKCSKAQKGNTNRRDGTRRKREGNPISPKKTKQ